MKIIYDNWLIPQEAEALEAAGWTLHLFVHEGDYVLDDNGLFQGHMALGAEKEFATVREAMFEVEKVLRVDVISEVDRHGCPLHMFVSEHGKSDYEVSWGWDCAVHMYGAPSSPRKAAEELAALRAKVSN